MVVRCFLCKTTYKNDKNIQMHKVPRKEHVMKLWLSALNIEHINSNARICSKHFTEQDFMISVVGERHYLKSDAVPSVNLQKDENNIGSNRSKEESIQNTQYNMKHTSLKRILSIEKSAEDKVPPTNIKIEENTGSNSSKKESIQNIHCNMKHTSLKRSLPIEQSIEEEVPLKNIRRINDIDIKKVSQSPVEAEACLEVLIEELRAKQKEVKRFRDKASKLQKTVKDLRSLIKILKDKLITSTARDTLKVS